mgnify:CR=1 FL=1
MKYKDFETLKKNEDFKKVYNKRNSYANRELIMYISKNGTDTKRLGVSVSKKVGNCPTQTGQISKRSLQA